MEITFRASKQDYINYQKSLLKENFRTKLPIIVIFFIIWIIFISTNFNWIKLSITVATTSLFIAILFYFLPLFIYNKRLNKLIASDPGYTEERKLTIQNDGLLSERVTISALRRWEAFSEAKINSHYISLLLKDKSYLMIPKSAFANSADAINFYGLAEAKITQTLRFPDSITAGLKKDKPPYLLGLLGFIPLVGAFVGISLLLYAIFKYKDKKLAFIGAGAIAFTIIVYGSLFYYGQNSKVFKNGFAELNKGNLNALVKEIEFYKLNNGKYPDSLAQLENGDQPMHFVDLVSEKEGRKFNYRLIGKKYTIFSSGIDQIPYTQDDIYPTITIDTNKMGLVINKKQ